ncbi:MAG: hypothetical protein H6700_10020 [Myxococcales bacterium]|nr:hypothetical protein [Myxococcales bacterium]
MNAKYAALTSISCAAALAAATPSASAQSACALPFETYLTDLSGAPFSGSVDLEITFWDGAGFDAAAIDCRTVAGATAADGWLRVTLDACDVPTADPSGCGVMTLTDLLATGELLGAQVWLGVRVEGDEAELSPRLQVGAVPYAVRATWASMAGEASVAGHADVADRATNADHADTCSEADYADVAGLATLADEATHAATADEATHAASADTATNANHATNADLATRATNADHATNADLATRATNADHATNADLATRADSLTRRRGETYAVWGRQACPAGHPQLYTGTIGTVVGTGGAGDTICLDGGVTSAGWVSWNGGMMWRANGAGAGSTTRGQYSNSANNFDCAVCEGNTYVHWGSSTCAAGYTLAYVGYMGSFSGGWSNGWGVGSTICLDTGAGANWTNWQDSMIMRAIGSSGDNRVQYQNGSDMFCAVCY